MAPNGNETHNVPLVRLVMRVLQGALIGLGAVLPGISGGVLCVIFGIYKPIMELLSNPIKNFKTHVPKLLPVILGGAIGFLGIANLLSFFLEAYPDQSVCLFVGLIGGMLPSLFREAGEQGRTKGSYISLAAAFVIVLALLGTLNVLSVTITPNFGWNLFCGFCVALSVIAPGMSFSTLLMPLGLYTPFVDGLGHLDMSVILPGALGAIVTVICLAKAIDALFEHFYSFAFHAIVGIVIAATLVIIPFGSFAAAWLPNLICLVVGVVCALALDKFNSRFPKRIEFFIHKKAWPPPQRGGGFLCAGRGGGWGVPGRQPPASGTNAGLCGQAARRNTPVGAGPPGNPAFCAAVPTGHAGSSRVGRAAKIVCIFAADLLYYISSCSGPRPPGRHIVRS